jgi:hypothetical protein
MGRTPSLKLRIANLGGSDALNPNAFPFGHGHAMVFGFVFRSEASP